MKVVRQLNRLAAGTAVVAFAAFAGVGLAQADGMPGGKVAYATPWNWGGFYFGVHSGMAWSEINGTFLAPPPESWSLNHSANLVGGHIGIQHQFGNIVLGVEGNLSVAFRNDPASAPCLTCGFPGDQVAGRLDDLLTIGPRLGWAMGKWMPYLTGGYANAAFTQRFNQGPPTFALAQTFAEARGRHGGWYIGGGVDMALSQGWTIGLEYRHYEFDDKNLVPHTTLAPQGVPLPGFAANYDVSADTVTVRVSWKFGRPDDCCRPLK